MSTLTLVHRRDCALCDEMLEELRAFAAVLPLPVLNTLDVDSDPLLKRRHGLHVPVLLLDDTVVCRHRLDAPELKRLLREPARG